MGGMGLVGRKICTQTSIPLGGVPAASVQVCVWGAGGSPLLYIHIKNFHGILNILSTYKSDIKSVTTPRRGKPSRWCLWHQKVFLRICPFLNLLNPWGGGGGGGGGGVGGEGGGGGGGGA